MTTIEETSAETTNILLEEYCGYEILRPVDHDKQLWEVQAHISCDNEEMALVIINEMLASEPNNQNLLAYKAYLLFSVDQNKEALQLCDQLLNATQGKGVSSEEYQIPKGFIHFIKASIFFEEENFGQTILLLNQAFNQENHPLYIAVRSFAYLGLHNLQQASLDATFAIENFTGYTVFQINIDEVLSEMYAIRAYVKQTQGQPWQSDYQEAINRGSDLLEDLF